MVEEFFGRFKESASKHHSEIVTELGLDAFCFNWGVYGSLLVTGYIAITGKLNEQIVCRPTVSSDGQDLSDQIKNYKSIEGFTLQYCWGTENVKIYNETAFGDEASFSCPAADPRQIIDWLPRILLLCALLHLIPRIYWDINVGHILKSYLSYMSNLITIIKGKCEKIPNKAVWGGISIPKAGIFDENSSTFDSNSRYELLTIRKDFFPGQNEKKKKDALQRYSNTTNEIRELFKEKMNTELRRRNKNGPKPPPSTDNANNNESLPFIDRLPKLDEADLEIAKLDEKDLKMKLDNDFTDRHLFSQLCYRNFAHLPDMTFIESVQRVVTPSVRNCNKLYDPYFHMEMDGDYFNEKFTSYQKDPIFGLDQIEKEAANYDLMNNMGVLWSITKLFTCERNFSGKELIRKYKIRLYVTMAISITPIIALATWQVWLKQYGEIVEIIRCTDETDSQFKCFLPTAGDITPLCYIYVTSIQAPIFLIAVFQLFRVHGFGEPQKSMDSNFIQKAMDDPLSYSALWSEDKYKEYMTRATIPESEPPKADATA